MENAAKNKIELAERLLNFFERRFVSTISSFVFGGFLIGLFMQLGVVNDKNDRIKELEEDRDLWIEKYTNGPKEMMNIYNLIKGANEGKIDNISIKEDYSQKLEEKTKQLEELQKP